MGFFTAFPLAVYGGVRPPPVAGFSLTTAGTMAWAAQAAYEVPDRAKLIAILDLWGWHLLDMFDRSAPGAKGFTALAGAALVVSIAGTEPNSIGTWFQNFEMALDDNGAHRGFHAGALVALDALSDRLSAHAGPVYMTGHSLGGAVVTLAASMLPDPNQVTGIYTIGMPRAGNAAYRDRFNSRLGRRTFRLVYGEDLVAKVPPSMMKFRHVGSVLGCARGGRFVGEPAIPPDEDASMAELAVIGRSVFGFNDAPDLPAQERAAVLGVRKLAAPIRDHLTDGYLRALGALT